MKLRKLLYVHWDKFRDKYYYCIIFYTQILMNVYLLVQTIAHSSVTTHLAVSSAHVGQDMSLTVIKEHAMV